MVYRTNGGRSGAPSQYCVEIGWIWCPSDLQMSQFATENNIVVISLPAYSSHRTQVLDFSIFSPFNTKIRNALNELILEPIGSV